MKKDITRSIRLDGDVAEKAQELADQKMLSKTISELLRNHWNLDSELDAMEAELDKLNLQRDHLNSIAAALADSIDEMKQERQKTKAQAVPHIERELKKWKEIAMRQQLTIDRARDTNKIILAKRGLRGAEQKILELEAQLEGYQ